MIQMRSALFSPLVDVQGVYVETSSKRRETWISLVERALHRWHSFWSIIHSNTPSEQWVSVGMYKNSYNIWQVARVLYDNPEAVDQLRHLDIPCPDKLAELKALLSSEE